MGPHGVGRIDVPAPPGVAARLPGLARLGLVWQVHDAHGPLSAFRAMSRAAEAIYRTIRSEGTQAPALEQMQTRAELYEVLGYHDYERKLDALFAQGRA